MLRFLSRYYRSIVWYFMLLIVYITLASSQYVTDKLTFQEPMPVSSYILPYLQNVTQHSIVVMWETTKPVIGAVDYGGSKNMERSVTESSPVKIHEVEITRLRPGRKYHYQVRYGNIKLAPSTFMTAPPDGTKEFRLVAYGDSRSDPQRHRRIVEQIAAVKPDLIINLGDLVSSGVRYEQWKPQFFLPLQIVSNHIPFYTCLGNHEGNSTHYFNYMSLPGNEVYYSFDYANAHFIALDSNAGYTPYDQASPQYRWLIEDLERHKNAGWIIVYFHHPVFRAHPTRGIEPQRYHWQTIFDKYGVDLVLNGHDHHYVRTYPVGGLKPELRKGVRHIITGGGGATLYNVVTDRNYIAVAKKAHHLVVIDFHGDKADVMVKDIDGNVIDSFNIDRTQITPPEEYVSYEVFELERDLRDAIFKMEPAVVESCDREIKIDTTITARSNFDFRLEGEMVWTLPGKSERVRASESNTRWRFDQASMEFAVNPGAELRIPVKATANYPDIYSLPSLTIYLKKIAGHASSGFRNREITIHPFKILPRILVDVPRIYSKVNIDGIIDEQCWSGAALLTDFITEQGDTRPKSDLLVRLAHNGRRLYVSADIKADPEKIKGILKSNPGKRDNRNIIRGEHLRINLSDGATIYTFAVDPHGTQMDAKDNDSNWNVNWVADAEATEKGWTVETFIPISVFGEDLYKKKWFINIGRLDSGNNQEALLAPTFDATTRENRLPEYSSSIKNPKYLPIVIFHDLD